MPTKIDIHEKLCTQMHELYVKKNTDYGDSFAKVREEIPDAILVRLSDKLNRLKSLMQNPNKQCVQNESIDDTLMDLANYCLLELVERQYKNDRTSDDALSASKQALELGKQYMDEIYARPNFLHYEVIGNPILNENKVRLTIARFNCFGEITGFKQEIVPVCDGGLDVHILKGLVEDRKILKKHRIYYDKLREAEWNFQGNRFMWIITPSIEDEDYVCFTSGHYTFRSFVFDENNELVESEVCHDTALYLRAAIKIKDLKGMFKKENQ